MIALENPRLYLAEIRNPPPLRRDPRHDLNPNLGVATTLHLILERASHAHATEDCVRFSPHAILRHGCSILRPYLSIPILKRGGVLNF